MHASGAHSTDLESPENVESLAGKVRKCRQELGAGGGRIVGLFRPLRRLQKAFLSDAAAVRGRHEQKRMAFPFYNEDVEGAAGCRAAER